MQLIIGHLAWLLASQNLKGSAIKCGSEFPHLQQGHINSVWRGLAPVAVQFNSA